MTAALIPKVTQQIARYDTPLSDSHLGLHIPQQVKRLQRSHIVEIGSIEVIPQRHKERVFQLEERELERAVAFYAALLYIMCTDFLRRTGRYS